MIASFVLAGQGSSIHQSDPDPNPFGSKEKDAIDLHSCRYTVTLAKTDRQSSISWEFAQIGSGMRFSRAQITSNPSSTPQHLKDDCLSASTGPRYCSDMSIGYSGLLSFRQPCSSGPSMLWALSQDTSLRLYSVERLSLLSLRV